MIGQALVEVVGSVKPAVVVCGVGIAVGVDVAFFAAVAVGVDVFLVAVAVGVVVVESARVGGSTGAWPGSFDYT